LGSVHGLQSKCPPDNSDLLFSEQLDFNLLKPDEIKPEVYCEDKELKRMVWEKALSMLKLSLLFNPGKI